MSARMHAFFDHLHEPCPVPEGARVEITDVMPGEPQPLPVGMQGTVHGGNGSQIWVSWDNGSGLALLIGVDRYRVLPTTTRETTVGELRTLLKDCDPDSVVKFVDADAQEHSIANAENGNPVCLYERTE